jgi:AcrR family transcriptional regulator
MSHNSNDLRVIKNRKAIQDALLTSLESKLFDDITVQDIATQALISRATFYRHFEDKYLLIEAMLKERIAPLAARFRQSSGKATNLSAGWLLLFEHIADSKSFYKAVLGKHGSLFIRSYVQDLIGDLLLEQFRVTGLDPQRGEIPFDVNAQFISNAFLGVVVWWLENELPYPPEQMAKWTMQLMAKGAYMGQSMLA